MIDGTIEAFRRSSFVVWVAAADGRISGRTDKRKEGRYARLVSVAVNMEKIQTAAGFLLVLAVVGGGSCAPSFGKRVSLLYFSSSVHTSPKTKVNLPLASRIRFVTNWEPSIGTINENKSTELIDSFA